MTAASTAAADKKDASVADAKKEAERVAAETAPEKDNDAGPKGGDVTNEPFDNKSTAIERDQDGNDFVNVGANVNQPEEWLVGESTRNTDGFGVSHVHQYTTINEDGDRRCRICGDTQGPAETGVEHEHKWRQTNDQLERCTECGAVQEPGALEAAEEEGGGDTKVKKAPAKK